MRKYIIEVSEEGIKKTFISDKKRYEETWVRDENGGSRTLEAGITAQLDQYGDFEDEELIELLDEDDIDGLWSYFEETKGIAKRGKLIKNLATCSKCKKEFECGGECWMNVAGDGAVWDVLSDHCKGTLKEQKLMDNFFSTGRKNKNDVYKFYNLSDEEKYIIENN